MKKNYLLYLPIIFTLIISTGCREKDIITLNNLGTNVEIHTDLQKTYLEETLYDRVTKYADGTEELSKPKDVELTWEISDEINESLQNYEIKISESSDLTNAKIYRTNETKISLNNFKISTDYYWNVTAKYDEATHVSKINHFKTTSSAPRNLNIDGVTNFRDLGGWKTETGKIVKQGLLYRSARFNKSNVDDVELEVTENGINTLLNELNIKSEIDLRTNYYERGTLTSSALGENVNYLFAPMIASGNLLTNNTDTILKIFTYLSNPDNYPAVYHCHIGTDRTGMLSYIINGLLGVNEDDLLRDYLFSNFGNIGGSRKSTTVISSYGYTISSYNGNSLSEKIQNYLLDIGVTQFEIDSIKSIMLA